MFECGGIRPALLHLEDGKEKSYGGRQFLPAKCWVSLPYYVMKGPMRVYYDEEGDFLEISIGKPMKCGAEEIEPGVFIRTDEKTDEVKSIGILGFKKRTKHLKNIKLDLPIEVNFSAIRSLSKAA